MSEFNTAADSQLAYSQMPNGGLDTLSPSGSASTSTQGMTQQQKLQMAQMAGQMLMKGFSGASPSMGGPLNAPQGTATQAPNAGQFIYANGAR